MRTFKRFLRTISVITLFFFCWTFLPMYAAVAWAAQQNTEPRKQKTDNRRNDTGMGKTSGERFENALEAIREKVAKADEKSATNQDVTAEVAEVKKRQVEIETLDVEFKKEFSATEKKLKDAGLPKEILGRHYKFVKHYEDNLKELKANLDAIDKPSAKSQELRAAFAKTKAHLEKTKRPSTHQKLDPQKLPFSSRKVAKAREPRTKEQFEKDFPQQRHQGAKTASGNWIQDAGYTIQDVKDHASWIMHRASTRKPIIVASNGPLTGLLSSNPEPVALPFTGNGLSSGMNPDATLLDSLSATSYELSATLLAQAADAPTAEDLAETPEVQFTAAIRAKAQELGGNPVRIYEWTRSNIEYAPTYGSIQGADQCLQSKICNDMDTASLLISLLRVSGIYAHYAYGTVDIPIEKAMNWVGGVTDPKMVGTILATNGIPATLLKTSGSVYKYVRMEHVWVSAFVDMIPSRGAVHKQGDSWVPLDPSYKLYTVTQGIDVASAVPFDAQSFANQILSTATTNTTDDSVTNVNSAFVQQTMQDYQTQVQNYIQQNHPNATVGDVIGKKEIIQQNYPILLGTLPYKTVQVGSEFATVPDNLRETMSFSIPDPTGASAGLSYTTGMPQVAGKKITLSFSPATSNDQAVIESLLPTPHADGTPIQPSELPPAFPAYLINLRSELRIDGQLVTTGGSGTMGSAQSFTMSLNEPGVGTSNIDNIIKAGEYFGIGLDTGRIGDSTLNSISSKLAATKVKLDTKEFAGLTKDDLIGDLLYMTIINYFAELDMNDEVDTRASNIVRYRAPSVGMCSLVSNVKEVFGIPISLSFKGMMMDVDRIMQSVFSKDGSMDMVKQYMLSSGNRSSIMEHLLPEELYSTPTKTTSGISAVKALQIASESGIPLYSIDQSNINVILPQLQIGADVKADIVNAVNAGKVVTVSKTSITLNGSIICGYIIIDPNTNAGAYMISSGTSGAIIEDSIPPGGLLIIATIGLILNSIATEAAAEEIEPTYYNFKPVPGCVGPAYLHTGEYIACVGKAFFVDHAANNVQMLLWAVLGLAYKRNPMLGFSLAVVSAIFIEALAIRVAAQCRQDAIHCDMQKN